MERKAKSLQFVKGLLYFLIILTLNLFLSTMIPAQEIEEMPLSDEPEKLTLKVAAMCEEIKGRAPYNPGIAFSSSLGRVLCFTDFDPVIEKTFIYHKYYFKDKLSSKIKLTLNPPRWATFSRIELRETDKGPWRVEIVDSDENILDVIRFSITD